MSAWYHHSRIRMQHLRTVDLLMADRAVVDAMSPLSTQHVLVGPLLMHHLGRLVPLQRTGMAWQLWASGWPLQRTGMAVVGL